MGSSEARKCSPLQSLRLDREKAVPVPPRAGRNGFKAQERSNTNNIDKNKIGKKKGPQPEELVKYMSNLPTYLQRQETGAENARALNFGVLDWGRLEKWKYEQRQVPVRGNGSKRSSTAASAPLTNAPLPPYSSAKSFSTGKLEGSNKGKRPSSQSDHLNLAPEDKPSTSKDSSGAQFKASLHKQQTNRGPGSPHLRSHGLKEKMKTPDYQVKRTVGRLRKLGIGDPGGTESVSGRHCLPEDWGGYKYPAADHGGVMVANRLSLGDDDLEFQFGPRSSDISYSCPLPCEFQSNKWPDVDLSSPVGVQVTKTLSNCQLYSSSSSDKKPSNIEWSECVSDRGRQPGPKIASKECQGDGTPPHLEVNRLGRSFSSKEVSSARKLDSPKTGSASVDCRKEKAKVGSRSRQSPLRRLLDQVLKPKQSSSFQENQLNDAPTSDIARKSVSSPSDAPTSAIQAVNTLSCTSEGLENESCPPSSVNALLQVSYKDEIPLFTFASTGEGGILIARQKKVFISGKDDFEWIYTFYSVQEVKKKGVRWMHQGQKAKKFATRTMGHMKVPMDSQNLEMVREFVLFGADLSESGHEALEFLPNNELAAIVVKYSKGGGLADACSGQCEAKGTHREPNIDFSDVTVILPSGVHGLPTADGIPSPLIDRWKSGGSCDCGGWDLGCLLTILDNQDQPDSTSSCVISDNAPLLDLFVKAGPPKSRHAFTFTASKEGVYSVDFGSSISLLQAFSICVAILHGLPANRTAFRDLLEEKAAVGPILSMKEPKVSTKIQRDIRASYVSSPPNSPVARA